VTISRCFALFSLCLGMRLLIIFFLLAALQANAQAPSNDLIDNAFNIVNAESYCSSDAAFTTVGATVSNPPAQQWTGAAGNDVWFKFIALKYDVNVSVTGRLNAASSNTLTNPQIAVYTRDIAANSLTEIPAGSVLSSNNVTTFYKGALTIGEVYYIRVSAANNDGTFRLCVDNFFPPLKPGQDCSSFSVLCSMEKFTQLNVSGTGTNNKESAGTCLGQESNSVWYKWEAAKSGTFTFLITPTVTTNDIDWILYDLGPNGNCSNVSAVTAIRCASGSGVTCTPTYFVTGLSMTETDLSEAAGCVTGQNGLVRYVDMIAGHNYALLVDNFSSGNNGFNIEFGGTTEFTGPTAEIDLVKIDECTPQQSFQFTSLATNYNTLKWTFGEGASMATATGTGPYNITYSTPGNKVAVLEATAIGGCTVVKTVSFAVNFKPATPTVTYATPKLCPGNTLTLQTPTVTNGSYEWTGPNGFTSTAQNPQIVIAGPENSGNYKVYVTVANCKSDQGSINIPAIDPKPEANFDIVINNFCQNNQTFTFKNTSLNSVTAVYDFGAGASSITTAVNGDKTVTYTAAGTKTITLTVTSPSGCVSILSKDQLVQLKPATPTISSNTTKYCPGNLVTLSTETVVGAIYHWSGPNGFTSGAQNPTLTVTGPESSGSYKLSVQVGDCYSDEVSINIPPIDLKPVAFFDLVINNPCLTNQSYTFKNGAQNYSSINWDFGTGVGSSTTNANGDVTVIYTTNGLKTIKQEVISPSGCVTSFTLTTDVQLRPATPVITINQTKFCLGDVLKMSVEDVPGVTYHWSGPNNFTASTRAVEITINDFAQAGLYQVYVQIGDCKSYVTTVIVPPIALVPIASFSSTPIYYGKYAVPFPMVFINNSKYADSYLWDFGDGTTSTEENPTHIFEKAGKFKITLTAFADEGCSNTTDIGELIVGNAILFIPNTFSPNGDGVNDEFVVTVLNLKKYKVFVYNRLGEQLFKSTDIFDNWKGKYRNQDVPVGVYYYVIYGTNVYNIDVKYTGAITIIR
jgi:gliding motility-associated-like protein